MPGGAGATVRALVSPKQSRLTLDERRAQLRSVQMEANRYVAGLTVPLSPTERREVEQRQAVIRELRAGILRIERKHRGRSSA